MRDVLWPRRFALLTAGLFILLAVLYSFLWIPVVDGGSAWEQPGDLWSTFHSAHWVGYGDISDLYEQGTGFITFPGIAILLAPLAVIASHFHLSESFPLGAPHPSAWILLGPAAAVLASLVLVPLDDLARILGTGTRRRIVLLLLEAALLWPLTVVWGHPEVPLAVGLALYGLLAANRRRVGAAGWCLGLAVLLQPLCLLLVPLVLAQEPVRRWVGSLIRVVLPSTLALALPLASAWKKTTYALVKQPTPPYVNHPTPFLFLSYHLPRSPGGQTFALARGRFSVTFEQGERLVSPGPARLIALGIAVLIGAWAWRRLLSLNATLWLAALALAVWCAVEPVMTPYYLWPTLAVTAVVVAHRGWIRLLVVAGADLFVLVWSNAHFQPWVWYGPIMAVLALGLGLACPRHPEWPRRPSADGPAAASEDLEVEVVSP